MKIAYVSWLDSTEYEKREHGERAIPLPVQNAGFLIYEADTHIELGFYHGHASENHYDTVISIPKACIQEMSVFEI